MGSPRGRGGRGDDTATGRNGGARLTEEAFGRGRWEGLGTLMAAVAEWQLACGGVIWILCILEGVGMVTEVHRAALSPGCPDELSAWRPATMAAVRGVTRNSAGSS